MGARARLLPDDRRREPSRAPARSDLRDARAGRRRRIARRRDAERPRRHGASRATCTAGRHGAGHFVKMVHNGIEYGLMAAYAEGFNILRHANVGQATQRRRRRDDAAAPSRALPVRLRPGRHRRGVAARQRGRLVAARPRPPRRSPATRRSTASRAGCRTRARGAGRSTRRSTRRCRRTCSSAALFERFSSRGEATSRTLLSAMRFEFGGHVEKRGAA